ncbi:hypothetical protein [Roseibium sp. M-1]
MLNGKLINSAFVAVFLGQFAGAAIVPAHAVPFVPDFAQRGDGNGPYGDFLLAQYNESSSHSSEYSGDIDNERDPSLGATYDYDDKVTRGVVWLIESGSRECEGSFRPEYRFDCLKNVLARAASTIERRPNYQEAGRELRSLSRKLDSIVTQYQDTSAPRATQGRRSYRAVSQANIARASREATAAIEETATKLLRSAGNSEKRKVHYSQIASAVGSTKRLLRS